MGFLEFIRNGNNADPIEKGSRRELQKGGRVAAV
jgi:hypothetical protein